MGLGTVETSVRVRVRLGLGLGLELGLGLGFRVSHNDGRPMGIQRTAVADRNGSWYGGDKGGVRGR